MGRLVFLSFPHCNITTICVGGKPTGGALASVKFCDWSTNATIRGRDGGKTAVSAIDRAPEVTALIVSFPFEKQCPAQPLLIGLGCFFATREQCSQCAGDIGCIGVIFISITSSFGMGMEAAYAIGIMQTLPSEILAINAPSTRNCIFM